MTAIHTILPPLVDKLKHCTTVEQKLKLLKTHSNLPKKFYKTDLPPQLELILHSLFVIGQGERIFEKFDSLAMIHLLESLVPAEVFYDKLGGLVGYHLQFIKLLEERENPLPSSQREYLKPPGINISSPTPEVRSFIRAGIEKLSEIAEIYPIGGAADRLDLRHPESQEAMPAAALNFLGYSLIEGLIRDVIGREYLHFKLQGKQVTLPLVFMSSNEKNNLPHTLKIFNDKSWYHRPKDNFFFIEQPLVPMIRSDGEWVLNNSHSILLKPGGHGALWKLLQDQGGLEWLKQLNRKKALIRQINNPIAGVDYGLLFLGGYGCQNNKIFGFSSCERYVKSDEGMDVLILQKIDSLFRYSITNVEYTEFEKKGIKDCSEEENGLYSKFPANTNILFVHLTEIEKIIASHPFPGLLINLKAKDDASDLPSARLESTMQNIADYIISESSIPLNETKTKQLPVFVTYNRRQKTLAATKKTYQEGKSIAETPVGVLITVLSNAKELLELCEIETPLLYSQEEYIKKGPSFLFTYHPALGPLYQVISQKLKKGRLHEGAELKLEIAEVLFENVDLKGSLLVIADRITGHVDGEGITRYNSHSGKCILKNVVIENEGIDRSNSVYWNYEIKRKEALSLFIEGNGEFIAENVNFQGNYTIKVPSGHRVTAFQKEKSIEFKVESLSNPSWEWNYSYNASDEIILTFKRLASNIS